MKLPHFYDKSVFFIIFVSPKNVDNMFERKILAKLNQWKESPYRKPLVLRGARQVGKTTVVELFAREFDQYIYLNLEKQEDRQIFIGKRSTEEIIDTLFFQKNKIKNNKKTLIFIDEIQELPEAINSLRYFYEEYPEYFVISAGSLLELVFDTKKSFPVGRVDYLMLYPFSFEEFLNACGETATLEQYHNIPVNNFAHEKLMTLFHRYTLIGGMPEIIKRYAETQDLIQLKSVYENLLLGYINDVEKYARNQSVAQQIRHAIPACFREAGSRITFHGFGKSTYGSREMGEALRTLERAKLIYLTYPTTQTQIPFMPDVKKSPRLQILDTGLLNYFSGIQKEIFSSSDLTNVYNGRVIEHIVGQELISNSESEFHQLLFWVRDKSGSSSEVDFLYRHNSVGIPVEVKSGKIGKLRSLHQYVSQSDVDIAVRLYAGQFHIDEIKSLEGKNLLLINLPYYLAGKIKYYIEKYS